MLVAVHRAIFNLSVELIVCQMPRCGASLSQRPYLELDLLMDDLIKEVTPLQDKPLVFFGHSMGEKIAYELAMRLRFKSAARASAFYCFDNWLK